MRPKKVILLISASEVTISLIRMVLETHAYRVVEATGKEQSAAALKEQQVDLVLCVTGSRLSASDGNDLIAALKKIKSYVPMILLVDRLTDWGSRILSADVLISNETSARDLLERIKVMSARKRGPRKKIAEVRYVGVA